jgi:hypothetical protein
LKVSIQTVRSLLLSVCMFLAVLFLRFPGKKQLSFALLPLGFRASPGTKGDSLMVVKVAELAMKQCYPTQL